MNPPSVPIEGDADLQILHRAMYRSADEVLISAGGNTTSTQCMWLCNDIWVLLEGEDDEPPGPGWHPLSLVVDGKAWALDVEPQCDGSLDLRLGSGAILNLPADED